MGIIGIILVLIVLALIIAALLGQLPWKSALTYMGIVGFVALALHLLLPYLR